MYLIGSAWNRCFSRVWNSIKPYLWTGFVKTQKLNVNMNCSEHFFLKFLCVCATSFHCHFWCFISAFSESTDHTGQQFSTWLHIRLCGNFLTKSILKIQKLDFTLTLRWWRRIPPYLLVGTKIKIIEPLWSIIWQYISKHLWPSDLIDWNLHEENH